MRNRSISLSALALSGAVACSAGGRWTTDSDIGSSSESLVTRKVVTQHDDNAKTGANLGETSSTYAHYVRNIDIRSGADLRSAVKITASQFQSQYESQRSAMTLANGQLYIGFAGYCDTGPYHGFLYAYNASTLAQTAVYNAT